MTIRTLTRHVSPDMMGLTASASYRMVSLVLGFGVNLFVVSVIARKFGAAEYGLFALIASIIYLMPFADLGLGAGVVNSTSDLMSGKITSTDYHRGLRRTRSWLIVVCAVLVIVSIGIYLSHSWPRLLGAPSSAGVHDLDVAASYTLLCVAAVLPMSLGARVLQGLGRMRSVVKIAILGPVVQGVVVIFCFVSVSPLWAYICAPATAYLVVGVVTFVAARRALPAPSPPGWQLRVALVRRKDDRSLVAAALPFFLISVGLAVGVQSHRMILAHMGTIEQVAEYSFVAQFTSPVVSVLAVTGQNLWPKFRGEMASGSLSVKAFVRYVMGFCACGLFAGLCLFLGIPLLASIFIDGAVRTPLLLLISAAAYVGIVGLHQPGAMLLTDTGGLRQQAFMVLIVAGVSLTLASVFISVYGSATPYLALALSMVVLQVAPTISLALGRIRTSLVTGTPDHAEGRSPEHHFVRKGN